MATSRERFLQTLDFKPADPPWVRWGSFLWDETLERWHTEGYDGRPLEEVFDLDTLVRVDPWYGPVPEFAHQVIEEDERTVLYVNHEGILMREFKEHHDTSMPQFVKFPVETESEWEKFVAERLALNAEERLNEAWRRQVASGRVQAKVGKAEQEGDTLEGAITYSAVSYSGSADHFASPRLCWADRWGGFFGSLRNMLGVQHLCMAFHDEPKWVERMMAERADAIIQVTEEVLKYTQFETFWYWEDMAYKAGPLVGPRMFRKFALPHYRRVCDWLRSRGIKHIGLDSDGNIDLLIPIWLEAGIDTLWPFEVQAGMDVLKIRQQYGHDLVIMGGLDKRALVLGDEVMRREVDRVMPLVEDGGYIPELDHSVPPDVSWPNFVEFLEYVKFRLGRG